MNEQQEPQIPSPEEWLAQQGVNTKPKTPQERRTRMLAKQGTEPEIPSPQEWMASQQTPAQPQAAPEKKPLPWQPKTLGERLEGWGQAIDVAGKKATAAYLGFGSGIAKDRLNAMLRLPSFLLPEKEGTEFRSMLQPKTTAEKVGAGVSTGVDLVLLEKGVTKLFSIDPAKRLAQASKIAKWILPKAETAAQVGTAYELSRAKGESEHDAMVNAFFQGAGPYVGKMLRGAAKQGGVMASEIYNWIMRVGSKEFRFGRNPGATLAKYNIGGTNIGEFYNNIVGKLDELTAKVEDKLMDYGFRGGKLDASYIANRLNSVLVDEIGEMPGGVSKLGKRIAALRDDLLTHKVAVLDASGKATGNYRRVPIDPTQWDAVKLNSIKTKLGKSIDWINATPTLQYLNRIKREMYGELDRLIDTVHPDVAALNDDIASLLSSKHATRKVKAVMEASPPVPGKELVERLMPPSIKAQKEALARPATSIKWGGGLGSAVGALTTAATGWVPGAVAGGSVAAYQGLKAWRAALKQNQFAKTMLDYSYWMDKALTGQGPESWTARVLPPLAEWGARLVQARPTDRDSLGLREKKE